MMMKLMKRNSLKSSETDKKGLLKPKAHLCPLLLDPRAILDYIDLCHKDPNTPMPDFKLTPGQSHMLTHFIQEEKWKYDRARQIKKSQYRKEKLLRKNVLRMKPEELIKMQADIKTLIDDFDEGNMP